MLLSLAASDLGVGLLGHPLLIAVLVMGMEGNTKDNPKYNKMFLAYVSQANLFSSASFCGVTALSVDRFLAIRLHLRYQERVTHKRVVAVVISVWGFSAVLSLVRLWTQVNVIYFILAIILVVCLITQCSISQLKNIHGRSTPCTPNPSSSGTESGTEWRGGEFWKGKEICGRYNLHISRVFDLLFTKHFYVVGARYLL